MSPVLAVCTYCSTGDLHALWRAAGRFAEATVRLFAAELVLVLGEWPATLGTATLSPRMGSCRQGQPSPGVGCWLLGAVGVAAGTVPGGDPLL